MTLGWESIFIEWIKNAPTFVAGVFALVAGYMAFLGARRQADAALLAARQQSDASLKAIEIDLRSRTQQEQAQQAAKRKALASHLILISADAIAIIRQVQMVYRDAVQNKRLDGCNVLRSIDLTIFPAVEQYNWEDIAVLDEEMIGLFYIFKKQSKKVSEAIEFIFKSTDQILATRDQKQQEVALKVVDALANSFDLPIKRGVQLLDKLIVIAPNLIDIDTLRRPFPSPFSDDFANFKKWMSS